MASAAPVARGRPSIPRLIFVFAKIGLLSFGGGSSTLVLMQQECMERTRWLSADDFAFTYALSRMYSGIHLVAQAVLIGYLLRGLMGAMASSLGMLVPSTLVTIVFTIFFVQLTSNPIGGAVLDGVLPATAGLTLAVGYRLTTEEITGHAGRRGWRRSPLSPAASWRSARSASIRRWWSSCPASWGSCCSG